MDEHQFLPRHKVADATTHVPVIAGCLKVPCKSQEGHAFVKTFCAPKILASILSPDALGRALGCRGHQTFSDFIDKQAAPMPHDCLACLHEVQLDLDLA